MTTLQEFLMSRYRELRAERRRLLEHIQNIEKEIEQVERAAEVADIKISSEVVIPSRPDVKSSTARPDSTMKEAAVEILTEATGGLTTNEILEVLNARLGTRYPRSSLSPQLSRLKGDGILFREDGRWLLLDKKGNTAASDDVGIVSRPKPGMDSDSG